MSNVTISVPITREQERFIDKRVRSGLSANKAHAVRQAITALAEEELLQNILEAESEPSLKGDLRKLLKRF